MKENSHAIYKCGGVCQRDTGFKVWNYFYILQPQVEQSSMYQRELSLLFQRNDTLKNLLKYLLQPLSTPRKVLWMVECTDW